MQYIQVELCHITVAAVTLCVVGDFCFCTAIYCAAVCRAGVIMDVLHHISFNPKQSQINK